MKVQSTSRGQLVHDLVRAPVERPESVEEGPAREQVGMARNLVFHVSFPLVRGILGPVTLSTNDRPMRAT